MAMAITLYSLDGTGQPGAINDNPDSFDSQLPPCCCHVRVLTRLYVEKMGLVVSAISSVESYFCCFLAHLQLVLS